jgi:Icc-related predicted phosphoesterase
MVLVVHAPPQGTPVASALGDDMGDPAVTSVAARMAAGSVILSGHLHDPRRWFAPIGDAWCFNPGVDFAAAEPNHVVIDTAGGEATFRGWGREVGPVRIAGRS